jgi:hypothetical protein
MLKCAVTRIQYFATKACSETLKETARRSNIRSQNAVEPRTSHSKVPCRTVSHFYGYLFLSKK